MQFHFSDHVLDVDLRELTRGGESVAVEPQVFDLLVHLIENRDHVVTKDDLIETVWDGRIVSESTLTSRINAARRAVGDSGKDQTMIRTLARKGFRFVGDVQPQAANGGEAHADAPQPLAPPASRCTGNSRRSIAPRSRCCRLPISPASRSRNIFRKASARTSSPRCRSCAGSM